LVECLKSSSPGSLIIVHKFYTADTLLQIKRTVIYQKTVAFTTFSRI